MLEDFNLDYSQIINSLIGSGIVALIIVPLIIYLWGKIKEIPVSPFIKKIYPFVFFLVYLVALFSFASFASTLRGYTPGLKPIYCVGGCEEITQEIKLHRCYMEAIRNSESRSRTMIFFRSGSFLEDFQQCLIVEKIFTVECESNEPGCIPRPSH